MSSSYHRYRSQQSNMKSKKTEYKLNFEDVGEHCIVSGETYDVKEHLLSMGGAWVKKKRSWYVSISLCVFFFVIMMKLCVFRYFIPDMHKEEIIKNLQKILDKEAENNESPSESDNDDEDDEDENNPGKQRFADESEHNKMTSKIATMRIDTAKRNKSSTNTFTLVNQRE